MNWAKPIAARWEIREEMKQKALKKVEEKRMNALAKHGLTEADLVQIDDPENVILEKYIRLAQLGIHPHTGLSITDDEKWKFQYAAHTKTVFDTVGLVSGAYAGNKAASNIAEKASGAGYNVDPSMQAKDIEMGVLHDGAYIKNPTAQNINDLVKPNSNYLGGKQMNGQYMYVVDLDGNIIIGTRAGQHMPHPTLVGGTNPTVQGARIVDIRGGKLYSVDNGSGHFKPDLSSLKDVEKAFENLPSNIYHKDFKGFLEYK
jgi:hypothetical protein